MDEVNLLNLTFNRPMKKHTIFKLILSIACITSFSTSIAQAVKSAGPVRPESNASYPTELQGTYTYTDRAVPDACGMNAAMSIQKNARYDDTDTECKFIKATSSNGQYTINERCVREGNARKQSIQFELSGNILTVKDTYTSYKLKRCSGSGAASASSAANTVAASSATKKCTVNPGQAGVTTYLDEKLKRNGRSVRDFDTDYFVAEKTIMVGKQKILVGKLLNGSGGVIEAKSYADSDEWTCK